MSVKVIDGDAVFLHDVSGDFIIFDFVADFSAGFEFGDGCGVAPDQSGVALLECSDNGLEVFAVLFGSGGEFAADFIAVPLNF